MKKITTHKDLNVYQLSYNLTIEIFQLTKSFPREELYSLTDQIRRSSRSVPANIAEAFRKRRYEKAFIAKLSDSEGEAAETQVWLDIAKDSKYISVEVHDELYARYNDVLGKIVRMINTSKYWII